MNSFGITPVLCGLALIFFITLSAAAQEERGGQTTPPRIEGVVVDQSGAPVAGAEVSLPGGHRAESDSAGRFTLEGAGPKSGRLIIRAQGFATVEQAWEPPPPGAEPLRIVLVPAAVAEQVTVTASRAETRLSETAASVLVLSSADLTATAAVTLDDALRQVPGFTLFRRSGSRTANPTSQGVSLRGVGASGASRALVLTDGVPLNDPFGGWVYWGRVPRVGVERVEVLRGGASDLYGSAALGGVINVITRPAPPDYALTFEAAYGNTQTPYGSLSVSKRAGGWDLSLAAEAFYTEGYIIVDERDRGRVDTPAGAKHTTLEVTVARRLGDNARVFARGSLYGEVRANGTPLQTNRTHIRQASAGGDWRADSLGSFLARAYTSAQVYDQDFSAVAADRQSENLTRSQRVPAQAAGFTFQWSRAAGRRQSLVAGLDAREVRGASDERVFVAGRVTSLVGAGGRERSWGIFAQDVIRLSSRVILTAGARFDRWRNYDALSATRAPQPNAPTAVVAFADRDESAFSPRAAVLFKAAEHLTLNASMYRAFRAPTLNELYRSFRVGDTLTLANENLRAERLTGGEIGASFAPSRKLSLRGVAFWSEMTRPVANVTLRVTPALITRQRQNLGRTRSRGLEIEANAPVSRHWVFSGGYALTDATVREFPANTALEGLLIPQVARHQLTFQARYTNPARLDFSIQGRAVGAQFDDDQNRFPLDRFFTLDTLAARRLGRHVEIFAAAENIFNQRYTVGRTPIRTIGPPILARVGLRVQLGGR